MLQAWDPLWRQLPCLHTAESQRQCTTVQRQRSRQPWRRHDERQSLGLCARRQQLEAAGSLRMVPTCGADAVATI